MVQSRPQSVQRAGTPPDPLPIPAFDVDGLPLPAPEQVRRVAHQLGVCIEETAAPRRRAPDYADLEFSHDWFNRRLSPPRRITRRIGLLIRRSRAGPSARSSPRIRHANSLSLGDRPRLPPPWKAWDGEGDG